MLEVNKVAKRLEKWDVLEDINFFVAKGEVVGIIGPSGCGKSTLLSLLAGHLLSDRGEIYYEGRKMEGHTSKIALMPQNDMLFEWYTVMDNVIIPLVISGIKKAEARKIATPYLSEFGLEGFENVYPNQLSGGMRSRAAMLRTVLSKAEVLLLDEPFGALDAITRATMQDFLEKEVNELGISMIVVTHDTEEALYLCDRILVLGKRPATIIGEVEGGRKLGRDWLMSETCVKRRRKMNDILIT